MKGDKCGEGARCRERLVLKGAQRWKEEIKACDIRDYEKWTLKRKRTVN